MRTFRNISYFRNALFEMADCSSLHNVQKKNPPKSEISPNFSLRLKTGKVNCLRVSTAIYNTISFFIFFFFLNYDAVRAWVFIRECFFLRGGEGK